MKVSNCTENWNSMKNNETGKFCSSCTTSVYDIHSKSLNEIEKLKDNNNDKICGRISKVQLEGYRFLHPMKRFAIALFLVFGTGLFTTSYGQILESAKMEVTKSNSTNIHFSAKDQHGQPLSGVNINFDSNDGFIQGVTDEKGKLLLVYQGKSKINHIAFSIYKNNTFAFIEKEVAIGDLRFETINYNTETGEMTIGDLTFQEEFLIGDVIIEDWED